MMRYKTAALTALITCLALFAARDARSEDKETSRAGTHHELRPLPVGKIEEGKCKGELKDPSCGYTGMGGSFLLTGKKGHAIFGIHSHPDYRKVRLGHTELELGGTNCLNGVDGWVYKTTFDGKTAPSKFFFSAEPVYLGLGVHGHIVADYRDATGWAWKLVPLHRAEIFGDAHHTSEK